MRGWRFIVFIVLSCLKLTAQSPHGKDFKIECSQCHTADNWKVTRSTLIFNHDSTRFVLRGQHGQADCRACHSTLVFSEAPVNCISCHQDIHSQSLGTDCARCHNSNSWVVENISRMHELASFPLLGNHAAADCIDCHQSPVPLRFDRIGTACMNCHEGEYLKTAKLDHKKAGFSNDCAQCHNINALSWSTSFDHNFFPLEKGHDIETCSQCHSQGYAGTSTKCVDCHRSDFSSAANPDHKTLNLSSDCASCHTTEADWSPASFPVHNEIYRLEGAHAGVANDCAACHHGVYDGMTPKSCFGCHAADYDGTTDPNHKASNFPTACESCHSQAAWEPATFDHNKTKFPLTGAHIPVNCIQCHSQGYAGTSTKCVDCHRSDFSSAANPDHKTLNLSSDCASCHTTEADWSPASFPVHNEIYRLEGAHAGVANDCAACHHGVYDGTTPKTCFGCHAADYDGTTDPNHKASNFSTACESCHSQVAWEPASFDHNKTKFPLTGAHTSADCIECHSQGYTGTSTKCMDCHTSDFNTATNPNHKTLALSTDCATCHTTEADWSPASFPVHNEIYRLEGAHAGVANDCAACHHGVYNGTTPKTCFGCHAADYNGTTDPNHKASNFSTTCESCHSQAAWEPATFDHNKTRFPLTGAHTSADCIDCHSQGYTGTSTKCVDCHTSDFNTATNPNHKTLALSTDCATCHTTEADWSPASFPVHNEIYRLEGAHAGIANDCAACHHGVYNGTTPKTCFGCHSADYNATTDPNHKASNFPTNCESCHSQAAWEPATFDHNKTRFPLTGAHTSAGCIDCHSQGYTGTSTKCVDCHTSDFNTATNPNHKTLALSTDCATCHTTAENWAPAGFTNHSKYYVITGAHTAIANDCAACHHGVYNGTTPKTCFGCHAADYNGTIDPNHKASNFPTACESCHSQTAWEPASFDHNKTKFPLTGAHTSADCIDCHSQGYTGTSTKCVDCHTADFNTATNPNHKTLALSTDCATCHTTAENWAPAGFTNHSKYYVITGAHTAIANDCAACHHGVYNGTTPKTCFSCHAADYNGTTDPNHKASNFPTACESCHSQTAWEPASFDHNKTKFPLTGAHTSAGCIDCHSQGYTGTSTKCVDCHTADFNTATNPNHKTLALSTDCATCHTTAAGWTPASFTNHSKYYVITGAHSAIANDCAACHHGVYNGTTPKTCFGCHAADYNGTTDPNHKAANYPTNCESCHSQTAWEPASFDHNKTKFPLTGAHSSVDCIECHNKGYTGTSTKCVDCHTADFNTATNPNHKTLALSTDCATCHTTAAGWTPASFTNHSKYYVITGAHTAIANDCAACHHGVYNGTTPKTCFGCHATDYNGTTDPNHKASNFPTACESCHSQTAWEPASFDHNKTKFPLTGAHSSVDCIECHSKGYTGTSTKCVDCHTADFNTATSPNHKTLALSTDCATCHTTAAGWTPASFTNHSKYYVITGAHTAITNDCAACHHGVYNGTTPKTCFGCHATDYNTTTDPNHKAANYPTNCESCHSQTAWEPASFDHNKTKFPLTGAHTSVDCIECHSKGYTGTSTKCMDCHTADFNTATNPNHKTLALSTDCATCHTTAAGWAPASFTNHSKYYVITGAHTAIANDCASCHHGVYNGTTPKTCFGCHATDYNTTTDPNHKASNLPTTCESCHSQTAWIPASFDHNKTRFPLTGAHTTVDCNSCHSKGYTGTSTKCVDCHLLDYNAAVNPKHKALNLSTDCVSCHTTAAGWAPATFPVHNQYYVLSGAHANIANNCAVCHNGNYNGTTPKTCFGCHSADYNATRNPNHKTANFPTTCESCHSQSAWTPATFNHDSQYFRIYSGTHKGEWTQCSECHTNAGNFSVFSCTNCHEHNNKAEVDKEHKGESGYSYTPTSCYSCHRNE